MRETELQRRKRHKSNAGHRVAAEAMRTYHREELPKRSSESSRSYKRAAAKDRRTKTRAKINAALVHLMQERILVSA